MMTGIETKVPPSPVLSASSASSSSHQHLHVLHGYIASTIPNTTTITVSAATTVTTVHYLLFTLPFAIYAFYLPTSDVTVTVTLTSTVADTVTVTSSY